MENLFPSQELPPPDNSRIEGYINKELELTEPPRGSFFEPGASKDMLSTAIAQIAEM